ncbi:SDR family oxidoreductase [Pedobacter nutrimenti]|uniref:Putative oxidoreductase n=1 Tax=Pedobacter nutrimenti TaxID=1241337 RepID=A0A318UNT1_9SPHI|nr:SDR family NAD(P)-dependent oxidoreductase [Pedobacter nutrimenti]PYF77381.1 putative oxidoreductase [Pedobacter nutrimenti]
MKTSQNTVLITGGSAGIGFEMAKQLSAKGNHVIITGRNKDKLEKAAGKLGQVTPIVADVSHAADVEGLVARISSDFSGLNMIINNAGTAFLRNLQTDNDTFEKAGAEMLTNYLSVIRLNEKLLPLLKQQPAAAIVMVSSIVAFAPGARLATYAASKAALHSYSQSLRLSLEETGIKVFELMPPLVNTEFSASIDGHTGIPAFQVADEFMAALEKDQFEIRVAGTEQFYQLYLSSPAQALTVMNQGR